MLTEAECEKLRVLVSQAAEVISPNWPMRTFAYRNSLMGFEHLHFHDAISHAKDLLGGEGYLSIAEYRACYAAGRISEKELLDALRSREPTLATQDSIRVGKQSFHPETILLPHFVYGIDSLNPKLLQWQLTEGNASRRIRPDVPQTIKDQLLAYDEEEFYIHLLWSKSLEALAISEDGLPESYKHAATEDTAHSTHQSIRTAAEILDDLINSDLNRDINEHMVKWCAAFADEGMADWSMPSRTDGFYAAWKNIARREAFRWTLGSSSSAQGMRTLPERPEDAIALSFALLRIPEQHQEQYLRRHLSQLPGWTGYIRWRSKNPDYPEQGRHPIDPLEYLAVRMFYEVELAKIVCQRTWGINPELPDLIARAQSKKLENSDAHAHDLYTEAVCQDAWRLFHLAQFLDIHPEDLQTLSPEDARSLLSWLNRFPTDVLRPIWHEAYEAQYRNSLLTRLISHRQRPGYNESTQHPRPRVNAVFCIDARSESFRRHLEAQGGYATIGFAGFFGTPIYYRLLDREEELLLCPVLIKPKYEVREGPRWNQDPEVLEYMLGDQWSRFGHHLFHQIKSNPTSSYLTFDLFGFVFGLVMLGKTLLLKPYDLIREWFRRWLVPPVATQIPVEKFPEEEREAFIAGNQRALISEAFEHRFSHRHDVVALPQSILEAFRLAALGEPEDRSYRTTRQIAASEQLGLSVDEEQDFLEELRSDHGINSLTHQAQLKYFAERRFSPAEQAAVVENSLRVMCLTKGFARLVLLCAHGSTTENNPYASAYHCGACGGNPGGPTARVLASLANRVSVRQELWDLGIEIPNDTWFIAGEHNTTTDRVALFDLEEVPEGHRPDLLQLQKDLEAAWRRNTQERCNRLPKAPSRSPSTATARHTWNSSRDWAQVRPEWGLSSNAAFVIGRRSLTQGLTLDGRSFLHNYDQSQDTTGRTLETIMTAPLVVVQTINSQYFFSATDTWAYGSGTKVLHNVVSGVGVMLGRHSDLQTGFPLQSMTTGASRFHEPLRILAIIEADTERISSIISRHEVLQRFFTNEWMYLVSCCPTTGTFSQYHPEGTWKMIASPISQDKS
ncbi:MAG: hypothetical protein CMH81_08130 [Nitrospiraceae bacterium]|nr:hypothetical protein [Nitrospiraceae bacterium]